MVSVDRLAVLSRDLPQHHALTLMKDRVHRYLVGIHPTVPAETLEVCYRAVNWDDELDRIGRAAILENPQCPEHLVEEFIITAELGLFPSEEVREHYLGVIETLVQGRFMITGKYFSRLAEIHEDVPFWAMHHPEATTEDRVRLLRAYPDNAKVIQAASWMVGQLTDENFDFFLEILNVATTAGGSLIHDVVGKLILRGASSERGNPAALFLQCRTDGWTADQLALVDKCLDLHADTATDWVNTHYPHLAGFPFEWQKAVVWREQGEA